MKTDISVSFFFPWFVSGESLFVAALSKSRINLNKSMNEWKYHKNVFIQTLNALYTLNPVMYVLLFATKAVYSLLPINYCL